MSSSIPQVVVRVDVHWIVLLDIVRSYVFGFCFFAKLIKFVPGDVRSFIAAG